MVVKKFAICGATCRRRMLAYVCVWSSDVDKELSSDRIIIITVLVCVAVIAIAVIAIIIVWLYLAHRQKRNAADTTKNKEAALLVSPQSNETLLDMLFDGTGSGSGQALQIVNNLCSAAVFHLLLVG